LARLYLQICEPDPHFCKPGRQVFVQDAQGHVLRVALSHSRITSPGGTVSPRHGAVNVSRQIRSALTEGAVASESRQPASAASAHRHCSKATPNAPIWRLRGFRHLSSTIRALDEVIARAKDRSVRGSARLS